MVSYFILNKKFVFKNERFYRKVWLERRLESDQEHVALAGDPGSIPRSHTVAHNSSASVPGDPLPSLDLQAHI